MRAKRKGLPEKRMIKGLLPPKDKVEFFEEVLRLNPYPYQARFLQDSSPLKVIKWCRRAGKTTVMNGDNIHFAVHSPDTTTIVTMPKLQQVRRYISELMATLTLMGRVPRKFYEALIDRSARLQ